MLCSNISQEDNDEVRKYDLYLEEKREKNPNKDKILVEKFAKALQQIYQV